MPINWSFKEQEELIFCDDIWYEITTGGYISPHKLLANPVQVEIVNQAISIIQEYYKAGVAQGVILDED